MAALFLPLLVLCPLAAALVVFVSAGHLSARGVGWVACGGVGLGACISIMLAAMLLSGPPGGILHASLWEWVHVPGFSADIASCWTGSPWS
ncbi:hypothetical protein [Komagataeibacter kakiaceti]|uniref:hypothetical protein n=1 Tax=Komagataeibacter kakiaceti TaxID=943261 RepID=UPI00046E917C|nr:hypothetical protein [Komagataeibacter kakiaceti]